MKLSELAEKIDGVLVGNGDVSVCGVASIDVAIHDEVSFVANPKYASKAAATTAGAVIVSEDWNEACSAPVIRCANPDAAFSQATTLFYRPIPSPAPGIHASAVVAEDVELGEGASIGALCVVESGVKIGANTVISAQCYLGYQSSIGTDGFLHPQVSVREGCVLGDRIIIHNGTVVGSDGFGYSVDPKGVRTKIPQIGIVQIGDDVEIGANTTIDRARFGKTRIGNGVKIDNLVQIAHNVIIGDHSVLVAQVGIAGSSTLGKSVVFAGQSGTVGHVALGDGVVLGAKTAVTSDVPAGEYMIGFPAVPAAKFKRNAAAVARLPQLKNRVAELEKKISLLESKST